MPTRVAVHTVMCSCLFPVASISTGTPAESTRENALSLCSISAAFIVKLRDRSSFCFGERVEQSAPQCCLWKEPVIRAS
ncbi:hypothetical protein Peur_047582 [Populus x canadensis]